MEAIRIVYGPNSILPFSPDIEIAVDTPETEEIIFILVTNKKGKRKAKVSSLSSTDSKSKILLVSRAPLLPKIVTASVALKPAVTHFISAVIATTTSKPTQFQNVSLLVSLVSKPKPKAKSSQGQILCSDCKKQ